MPERNWNSVIAFGVALLLAIALFFSWTEFSAYQKGHADERESAVTHDQADAHQGPYSCRAIMVETGFVDWLACLVESANPKGGEQQAYYDLKAQQDMAAWAFGMLIVTLWLAVITLIGVVFVWRTLKATQEMARDTKTIGKATIFEAKRQAEFAGQSVAASEGQVEIARKALTLQHKPWLDVTFHDDFVGNVNDLAAGGADIRPDFVQINPNIAIENISEWPAKISHIKISADGFVAKELGPMYFTLRGKSTAWIDPGPYNYLRLDKPARNPQLFETDYRVDGAGWQKFRMNLPSLSVTIWYSSPLGGKYEAAFCIKPTGPSWGGDYPTWGGEDKNYDKQIG